MDWFSYCLHATSCQNQNRAVVDIIGNAYMTKRMELVTGLELSPDLDHKFSFPAPACSVPKLYLSYQNGQLLIYF